MNCMVDLYDRDGLVIRTSHCRSGMESFFIATSKVRGIKLFKTLAHATRAFKRQSKFSLTGYAPKVYGEINQYKMICEKPERYKAFETMSDDSHVIRPKKLQMLFGFKTQRVRTITYERYNKLGSGKRSGLSKLLVAMEKAKFTTGDIHDGNVGWIGRKLVAIDFGDQSS